MVLFCYSYTLSISNCSHKLSNSLYCAFLTSFSSETEIRSLSRPFTGQSTWRSGLAKRRWILMSKTCSIQIEFYTLLPKVCRMFTTNFSSKRKPECQVIFSQDCFPLNTSPFLASLPQTLRTASALMDDGMLALTITLFMQKFPISSCKSLVCRKIFPFCRTDSFGGPPWIFFRKSTTKSPIFFFLCLQMVAFEYFQFDLIFDISE